MQSYGWILMLDAPKSEVYAMTMQMRIFVAIFGILIIGLILVFSFLNRRQEIANKKLINQIVKTEKAKGSLNTAMFHDILTDVSNRVSLSMDLDKYKGTMEKPCYFALFNIADFSKINTKYGNDAGDAVLVNTAKILRESFENGTIYRTGSDEFLAAVSTENTTAAYNQVYRSVNDAISRLQQPQDTPSGVIQVNYKTAMIKKSTQLILISDRFDEKIRR